MSRILAGWALSGIIFSGGCYEWKTLAPPSAPRQELPRGLEMLPSAPEAGLTRLTLDANGEPSRVFEVLTSTDGRATAVGTAAHVFEHSQTSRPVCLTPCQVDLKPGLHELEFVTDDPYSWADVFVQVGQRAKVVRVALPHPGPDAFQKSSTTEFFGP